MIPCLSTTCTRFSHHQAREAELSDKLDRRQASYMRREGQLTSELADTKVGVNKVYLRNRGLLSNKHGTRSIASYGWRTGRKDEEQSLIQTSFHAVSLLHAGPPGACAG